MTETLDDVVGELQRLGAESDERAIKRAYAKALKVIRPDENAAAFQELHDAYQAALGLARYRAQRDATGSATDPDGAHVVSADNPALALQALILPTHDTYASAEADPAHESPPLHVPAAAPEPLQEQTVDTEGFASVVVDTAARSQPGAMSDWLRDHPVLWSLSDKSRIGDAVLQRLHWLKPPLHEDTFDVLAAFFGWIDLGRGIDPFAVSDIRSGLHELWLFHNEDATDHTVFRQPALAYVPPADDDPRLTRLRRPWNLLRALLSASLPGRAHDMGELMKHLRVTEGSRPLQPRQLAFWRALATPNKVNGPKMQLALFRSVLLGAGFAAFMLMLGLADGVADGHSGYWGFKGLALVGGLTLLLGGSLILPLCGFVQWQVGPEHPRHRAWVVRLLVIPLLALAALWIMQKTDARPGGVILAWLMAALALVRLLARGPFRMAFSPWMIGLLFVVVPLLKHSLVVLAVGEIAVAAALLLWATDAVNHVSTAHAPRRR